jgi:glycosyltransferase involved in cell wall biosynthesis
LVYPSSLEGFGFPPLEALALGIPVVAGDCEALQEHAGDAAILVDGSDPAAIADGIRTLWEDDTVRTRCLERWRIREDDYRWARCAASHVHAYTKLLEGGKA